MSEEVRRPHFARASRLVAKHGGSKVKTYGDSVMAVFRYSAAALDFALDLQADPGTAALQRLVRAGIHYGEVDIEGADIHGTEVNVAGRLIQEIKGAEIWLSDPAKLAVERNGAVQHAGLIWGDPRTIDFRGLEAERFTIWPLAATHGETDSISKHVSQSVAAQRPFPNALGPNSSMRRPETTRRPHNFEEVEILSRADVVYDRVKGRRPAVLAQLDFIPRFYVRAPHAYVEFELQRAFIIVWSDRPGRLSESDALRLEAAGANAYYLPLREMPKGAISVCIDPEPGRTGLARSALPPTQGENDLAEIAVATPDTEATLLKAELRVPLSPEGLFLDLAESVKAKVSELEAKHIKAILRVATTRNDAVIRGQVRKPLSVKERIRDS